MNLTIQSQCQSAINRFPPGYPVHISDLQVLTRSAFSLDMPYTYKQVRNALFRLRTTCGVPLKHSGKGWYCWDVQ